MRVKDKVILDACCSGRMFWFDKENPNCLYCDIREIPKGTIKNAPNFSINPDKVMDFKNMDLPDKSFKLVVFDPPHLKSLDKNSWVSLKYGSLDPDTWKADILAGFNECWRVLDDYGTLIFKWSKSCDNRRRRDVSIENLLKILPVRPLFGHPSGSKINTIWMCFMKIPEINVQKSSPGINVQNLADLNVHGAPCTPAGVQRQGKKLNIVELFSGSGTISKEFKKAGHNVFSIDIRKRKGICEPTLRKNIMHVTIRDIPFKRVDVVWASPPCDVFSKAAVWFHWNKDGSQKTQKCLDHLRILRKTLKLIERIHPGYFFIENPDGKMKYQKELVNFLIRNNGKTLRLHYRDYGFGTLKPTTIFTNALNYFGRSIPDVPTKRCKVLFNNLTKCKKQAIPQELAIEIREFCENHLK